MNILRRENKQWAQTAVLFFKSYLKRNYDIICLILTLNSRQDYGTVFLDNRTKKRQRTGVFFRLKS